MLEDINKVNWSQLEHAYGEASDVPVLIRKLLSPSEDERDKAVHELFGNIWHQGTIWEASSYAVPFLLELLKFPETPDKLSVVLLIANLATGKYGSYPALNNEEEKEAVRSALADDGVSLEDEIAKTKQYESAIRNEVSKEFNLFYPYLSCEEPVIRDNVAKVFGKYPQFKSDTLPLLEKALESESDEFAKETIKNSIKMLNELE